MNPTANIVIAITPEESIIFQKIKESGALQIGWGKVTLNFANGSIQNIVKEEIVWKR